MSIKHHRYIGMSTTNSARRAARRQSQDGSADKVVVNLDASSPVAGNPHGLSISPGARASPIDVEALDDEVQAVSPSQVPPPVNCSFLSLNERSCTSLRKN